MTGTIQHRRHRIRPFCPDEILQLTKHFTFDDTFINDNRRRCYRQRQERGEGEQRVIREGGRQGLSSNHFIAVVVSKRMVIFIVVLILVETCRLSVSQSYHCT
jgi:hypothetical protein